MYAKVFQQILDSTLAEDYQARHVFMDLLVLADREGNVDMTLESISRRANVPIDIVRDAVCKLCKPDVNSRSVNEDGKRLVPIDPGRSWGWRIVNFKAYHQLRDEDARRAYMRTYMQERRHRDASCKHPVNTVNSCKHQLAHVDVDVDVHEDREESASKTPQAAVAAVPLVPYMDLMAAWNIAASRHPRLTAVRTLGKKRKAHLQARWQEAEFRDNWARLFEAVPESEFLCGGNDRGWVATFDWLTVNDANYVKVLEGRYANRKEQQAEPPKDTRTLEDRIAEYVAQGKDPEAKDIAHRAGKLAYAEALIAERDAVYAQ